MTGGSYLKGSRDVAGDPVALTVLMVGPSLDIVGGMSSVAATLDAELRDDPRYRVTVLDSGGGRGRRGYRGFPAAVARVAGGRYDVLHLHVASRGSTVRKALLAALAKARSIPYVIHLHGAGYVSFLAGLRPQTRALVRRFFADAAGIVVLGDAWRDIVVRDLGVAPGRITVVNNGVRGLDRVPDADKPSPRRVVFVGEVSHRKGADVLASAWRVLVERGRADGWRCVCLGPTPDADVVAAIEAMPAAARATFELRGPVVGEAKDAVISGSSVFCLPSRAEGLPMALLEAMSAGLPGVCTDVGAIGEVLDDSNGRLIAADDAPGLVAALDELMNDDATRARLAEGAFGTWQARFTAERMARSIGAVWSAAAGGGA